MITCPECKKEIAEDSAHCGYCGAETRPTTGAKTMFGMGAVTAEDVEQAAAEAREKGSEASSPAKLELPKPGLPKAELPKPGLPKPGLPKPGLPKPGLPKAGLSESKSTPRPLAIPRPGASADVDAETDDAPAETAEPSAEEMAATERMPSLEEQIAAADRHEETPDAQPSPPARAPEGETTPAMTDAMPHTEPWSEPAAVPQGAPGGPVMAAEPKQGMHLAGAEGLAVQPAADKDNKKLVFAAIAIAGLVMMGCVGAAIWGVFTFLF